MSRDLDQLDDNRISRRSTLKGLGLVAGGAVAWTAPTILSVSAASAATVFHTCGATCGPDDCLDQTACGTDSGTLLPCFCAMETVTGTCICTQDVVPCAGLTACVTTASSPPGFVCQIGCCLTPFCFPVCA